MTERDQVRARAFGEAAAAVDRFLEKFGDGGPKLAEAGEGAVNRLRAELGRVVDLNLDLVRNAFALFGSVSGARDGDPGTLVLPPSAAGDAPGSIVWLHNFDEAERPEVRLVGTTLTSHEGHAIEASGWSFQPLEVAVPGRSGAPVTARLEIPRDASPGTYRGQLTAAGLDGHPIEVAVEVFSLDPVPHDSW